MTAQEIKRLLRKQAELVSRAHNEYLAWCKDSACRYEMEQLLLSLKTPAISKDESAPILAQIEGKINAMDAKKIAPRISSGNASKGTRPDPRGIAARVSYFSRPYGG
ncbi:MAG: hypothetical protein LBR41_01215 [Rickettsiales bacterium]|jgi:hypothetical protein|nr:hypothetical protein [Rickettsiales bacterium]